MMTLMMKEGVPSTEARSYYNNIDCGHKVMLITMNKYLAPPPPPPPRFLDNIYEN